jgi:hypothetical protein
VKAYPQAVAGLPCAAENAANATARKGLYCFGKADFDQEESVKIRLDKFTVAVLVVVGLLIAAALVTVNIQGAGEAPPAYRTEDAPETPIYNAFLALKAGDIAMARAQYSKRVLEEVESERGYGPLRGDAYIYGDAARRLRILNVRMDPENANRAYVTVAIDAYATGGLFSSGSTWTSERIVEVVREDGAWKINTQEYFY